MHAIWRKKGGHARKRRKWAEVLAGYFKGSDKQSVREALKAGVEIEGDEIDYAYDLEGDPIKGERIHCRDALATADVREIGNMTFRNFWEKYYRRS